MSTTAWQLDCDLFHVNHPIHEQRQRRPALRPCMKCHTEIDLEHDDFYVLHVPGGAMPVIRRPRKTEEFTLERFVIDFCEKCGRRLEP